MTPPLPVAEGAALLRTLASGGLGIRASRHAVHNYGAVFARDAIMAGVAGVLTHTPVVSVTPWLAASDDARDVDLATSSEQCSKDEALVVEQTPPSEAWSVATEQVEEQSHARDERNRWKTHALYC